MKAKVAGSNPGGRFYLECSHGPLQPVALRSSAEAKTPSGRQPSGALALGPSHWDATEWEAAQCDASDSVASQCDASDSVASQWGGSHAGHDRPSTVGALPLRKGAQGRAPVEGHPPPGSLTTGRTRTGGSPTAPPASADGRSTPRPTGSPRQWAPSQSELAHREPSHRGGGPCRSATPATADTPTCGPCQCGRPHCDPCQRGRSQCGSSQSVPRALGGPKGPWDASQWTSLWI